MAERPERRRVVTWDGNAPLDPAQAGIDTLRAMASGARPAPPIFRTVGARFAAIEPGRVRIALRPAEYHYNPIGCVHGGIIATILDSALATSVMSTLPPGRSCTTLEIKVNYLRALTEAAGEVFGEGVAVHTGRQVGVSEARLVDANGRIYATASTTLLVFDTKSTPMIPASGPAKRCFEWSDPMVGARAGGAMAGIDYLRAMGRGELPRAPFAALIGLELGEIEPGRVTMSLLPGGHLNNPGGTMHGGVMATLLDSVMGCAVHSTVPVGRGYTTLEIKVNYLRAITAATGRITGIGQVVHGGRQVGVAEGRAVDSAGQVYATASTTCLVFDR